MLCCCTCAAPVRVRHRLRAALMLLSVATCTAPPSAHRLPARARPAWLPQAKAEGRLPNVPGAGYEQDEELLQQLR